MTCSSAKPGVLLLQTPTYALKCKNQDFLVTEVPLQTWDAGNENAESYTYLWVRKDGVTTFAVLDALTNFFAVPRADVSAAGLKDEDAITRQVISIKANVSRPQIERFNALQTTIAIEGVHGTGQRHVAPRALHGNVFEIRVRNLDDGLAAAIEARADELRDFSMINYYDVQRFGTPGSRYRTAACGQAIIERDWCAAVRELQDSDTMLSQDAVDLRSAEQCHEFMMRLGPRRLDFYVAAYNSQVWNAEVRELVAGHLGARAGWLDAEQVGRICVPVVSDFSVPSNHSITGWAADPTGRGFVVSRFTRTVVIPIKMFCGPPERDTLHGGRQSVVLRFFCPTGTYATMAIRQYLTKIAHPCWD